MRLPAGANGPARATCPPSTAAALRTIRRAAPRFRLGLAARGGLHGLRLAVRTGCGAGRLLGACPKTCEVLKTSEVCDGLCGDLRSGAAAGTHRQGLHRHQCRRHPGHRFAHDCVEPGHRNVAGLRDRRTLARECLFGPPDPQSSNQSYSTTPGKTTRIRLIPSFPGPRKKNGGAS